MLPRIVEIVTAELSLLEKLALVPDAPVPVLPYSWKVTSSVFARLVLHCSQPAELTIDPRVVRWKTTLAYSLQGLPRKTVPLPAVELLLPETEDLLIT